MQFKGSIGTIHKQQYTHLLHTTDSQESWNISASYVIISDCLHHDTIALFQKNLVQFLQDKISRVDKILYFSDGSAAQYKNQKNFVNLCYHKTDLDDRLNGNSMLPHMDRAHVMGLMAQ